MTASVHIPAIILAAGASSRMGRPKALLTYQGETFLDRLIRVFAAAGCQPFVVLGHGSAHIAAALQRAGEALLLLNPHPERGQFSSLKTGLAAVARACPYVLFTPVDAPAVQPATVRLLLETALTSGAPVVAPAHGGRHGHPVALRRDVVDEMLALDDAGTARTVIGRHRAAAVYLETGDAGVLDDIDTPADWEALP